MTKAVATVGTGISVAIAADVHGVRPRALYYACRRARVKLPPVPHRTAWRTAEIRALSGVPDAEVAARMECTPDWVRRLRRRFEREVSERLILN